MMGAVILHGGQQMPYYTPLRYPGGKNRLYHFFNDLIDVNNLSDGNYIEPYAGGAGLALSLLLLERIGTLYLNDFDPSIYAFWHSVIFETDAFIKRIVDTEVTMKEWEKQKIIQMNKKSCSLLDLGFSTFFLNRTNRSGIIDGGVIGGKKQDGKWRLDVRFNKKSLIERIKLVAFNKVRIKLFNLDALDFLREVEPLAEKKTTVYLDPPYYQQGDSLYANFYKDEDHKKVATFITSSNFNWIVSYDCCDFIKQAYSGQSYLTYNLSYSAGQKYKGKEIMFFSPKLDIDYIKYYDPKSSMYNLHCSFN